MFTRCYVRAQTSLHALRVTLRDEEGVASAEFGILLALIAVVIIAAATALGLAVSGLFDRGTSGVAGAH
jgi:Flp pilus assembly pilin Flp